ncbi:MAG: molybdopterin-dependent oxidoreductase, partial [Leptospiraceae bacterium]|nr:molybdopterin-dependent oxidoreductase [Leptospiraceae bacterium]
MITRKKFLKIGAATFAGAAVGSTLFRKKDVLQAGQQTVTETDDVRQIPTFCEICFWKCGMIAHVKNNQVLKVTGNPDHPLANGRLCPRGTSALGIINDKDRLQTPLIRVKENGEETFKPVSWNAAFDYIAEKLQPIIERHGADKIALFSHGHGGSFFKTLMAAMGSKTITAPSYAQCRGPRAEGFRLTYGYGVGSPEVIDMPNARCVAMIGTHLGENMHNTAVQDLSIAIERGASFITVDPRYSTMAGKSDYWLPIKPGTDIALLLAWMNVMIQDEIYQKDFVANNTVGFEQLKEHVRNKTPEWAFVQTGIEPEVIRKTAHLLARNAPAAMVHPGRHVVWYGDDTQRSRAIAIINALLGNWGKKGGFYIPASYPMASNGSPPYPPEQKYHFPDSMYYPFATAIPAQSIVQASRMDVEDIPAEERIRAWIVYGCNAPMTLPDPEGVEKAMSALELLVAVDILPMEITGYADVVLPECTFLERHDDFDARPNRTPYVAIRQPVVEPMYQSRPGWWIAKELARRIQVNGESLERYFPYNNQEEKLKTEAELSGFSYEEIKSRGAVTKSAVIYDYNPQMRFPTPSGKIELYSDVLKEVGFDPLPEYYPPEEPPNGYFRLLFGRHPVHTFSRTTNNNVALEIFGENELWVNAKVADYLGLKSGYYVTLENQDGARSDKIKVKVTQRIRQDCVY